VHAKLVETNNVLVVTLADNHQRPLASEPQNTALLEPFTTAAKEDSASFECSQSAYPEVKYWFKQAWKDAENQRKDLSNIGSPHGGGRSAMGENVMMLYIEKEDGMPVDGSIAGAIWDDARSIWQGFYNLEMAPEKWGDASKEVRDVFVHEIEKSWFILCLCDNHWKTNTVATSIYSQWYCNYDKRKKGTKDNAQSCDEPKVSAKMQSTTPEEPCDSSPPPARSAPTQTHQMSFNEDIDEDIAKPSAPQAAASRPRPRPIQNPL